MKKLLITGFEPFLNNPINPTEDIVKALNKKEIGHFQIEARVLPVDFDRSADELIKVYEDLKPDAVIMLGLAAGRKSITPERIAINCNDGARDNTGFTPLDQPIDPEGPDGYFSTLPIRKFVNVLKEAKIPAEISNTAGTYLCNNVMYRMIHHLSQTNRTIPAGFVHIPASHDLSIQMNSPLPSYSKEDLIHAVEILVGALEE